MGRTECWRKLDDSSLTLILHHYHGDIYSYLLLLLFNKTSGPSVMYIKYITTLTRVRVCK